MAYANPSTFVAGNALTAAQQNVLANNDRFLHGPPTVRVQRDAVQALTISAWTEIAWDTENWDTNTMWSSTAAHKIFARTAGKYLCTWNGGFADSTVGTLRGMGISKNSTVAGALENHVLLSQDMLSLAPRIGGSAMVSLSSGQFIEVQMFADAAINTSTGDGFRPQFSMIWMSS